MAKTSQDGQRFRRRFWLYATVLLTVGSVIAAIALAPATSADPTAGLSWLLFVGTGMHVASTGWLYTLPEIRGHARKHMGRFIWIPACLITMSAIAAMLVEPKVFVWALLPYFAWQFFHFQKQNLGMTALTASSRDILPLKSIERRLMMATGWTGIAALVARPGLLQLDLDPQIGLVFDLSTALFVTLAVIGTIWLFRRPKEDRPLDFCVVYLVALLFSLPVFVFESPYAAVGGMTIAHGLQYLLLVGLLAAGAEKRSQRLVQGLLLVNIALVGGIGLTIASHLHNAGAIGRLFYGAYLGALMAHFVIDAGVWRLRDSFPRRFLAKRLPYLVREPTTSS